MNHMHTLPFDAFFIELSSHKREVQICRKLTIRYHQAFTCFLHHLLSISVSQKPTLCKSDSFLMSHTCLAQVVLK